MARPRKDKKHLIQERNSIIYQLLYKGYSQTDVATILRLPKNTVHVVVSSEKKPFMEWLRDQAGRECPIGDLGTDVLLSPPEEDTYESLRDHLDLRRAGTTVMETLNEAVEEWSTQKTFRYKYATL